jgi:hypothetical protein
MCLNVAAFERQGREILTHGCDGGKVSFQILNAGWQKNQPSVCVPPTSRLLSIII